MVLCKNEGGGLDRESGVVGRPLSLGFTRAWMLVLPGHPFELSKLTGLGYLREALEGITLCLTSGIKFTLTRTPSFSR